jgi:hypothetical protein
MKTSSLGLVASILAFGGCDAVEGGAAPTARVRVAHLSPGAPAVDFCVAPAGSGEFAGPVLAGAGAATGLPYGSVTKYLDLEAIQYDVRLVAPGSADCSTTLGGLPDFTNLPALPAGASATIAAEGHVNGTVPFGLTAYIDDSDVTFGKAKLRFIHASPGTPAVDVGLGGGALFTPVFAAVAYGSSGTGYVETAPIDHGEISARASGTTADVISIKPVAVPAGTIATAFAIGEIGNPHTPLDVLLCIDNAASADLLSACKTVGSAPDRARVRIAHLSPDAPPVDVCIAEAGSANWSEPLLRRLGATTGLAYSQVTTYVELPTRAYDIRVILATSTGCAAGAVPDTLNVTVTPKLTATIAAIGIIDRSGPAANDPAFRLQVLVDELTVGANKTKLRFFHASPGTPAVDVGLGVAHGFVKVFGNVSFGQTAPTNGTSLSNNGFVETTPVTSPVSARLAGALTDALTIPSVTLAPNAVATAIAIGGKTGTHTNPLRVLLCADTAPANGLLSACSIAP